MAMDIRRSTIPSAWALMEQLAEHPWSLFSTRMGNGGSTGYNALRPAYRR